MGGTAGLFLGASLLTLVELAYYACRTPSHKLTQQDKGSGSGERGAGRGWDRQGSTPIVRRVLPALAIPEYIVPPGDPLKQPSGKPFNFTSRNISEPIDLYM